MRTSLKPIYTNALGDFAYDLGYFLGNSLPYILLFICVITVLYFIRKARVKKTNNE